MTSFTKALYRRDPAAAEAFHRAQQFEHKMTYGKNATLACFTLPGRSGGFESAHHNVKPVFGKRTGNTPTACAASCGHPACANGCTLVGQQG